MSEDFPVVRDASGKCVSRYSDPVWDLTPYSSRSLRINFGDSACSEKNFALSSDTANAMRKWAAWLLYKHPSQLSASSIVNRVSRIRHIFKACDTFGVQPNDLHRFPKITTEVFQRLAKSVANNLFFELHEVYANREELGFSLVSQGCLRELESMLPDQAPAQTAFIPPRIWQYQISRLQEFLDDFLQLKESIERVFRLAVLAYDYKGSPTVRCGPNGPLPSSGSPFTMPQYHVFRKRFGLFDDVAKEHGIYDLLVKWVGPSSNNKRKTKLGLYSLSKYFQQIQFVAGAYIINFTGMRKSELAGLRASCLVQEMDPRLGNITLVRGRTSKTVDDQSAHWVSSPSVCKAILALQVILELRTWVATHDGQLSHQLRNLKDPHLLIRAYEPWAGTAGRKYGDNTARALLSYNEWKELIPDLFDEEEITILENDFEIAKLINPSLDDRKYGVGMQWHFSFHQIRRTIAVNMAASDLVRAPSLQIQLKHLSRSMSLYYGHGYSSLHLEPHMREEYIRATYASLGRQAVALLSDQHVSPYGISHKHRRLWVIENADREKSIELAKKGRLSYRETLLGGCLSSGPCKRGGIDDIIDCGGGKNGIACPDALFDQAKQPKIKKLADVLSARLDSAPPGSPLEESLSAQLRSAEFAIKTLREARKEKK